MSRAAAVSLSCQELLECRCHSFSPGTLDFLIELFNVIKNSTSGNKMILPDKETIRKFMAMLKLNCSRHASRVETLVSSRTTLSGHEKDCGQSVKNIERV